MLFGSRRAKRAVIILSASLAVFAPLGVSPALAAPSHTVAPSDVVVKRGDTSEQVVQVQRLLIAAGITVRGGDDGIFGPGTEVAVKQYQGIRGLPVNGQVDNPTAVAMGIVPAKALLAQGSSGAGVVQVQKELLAVGIAVKGGADGAFGPSTATAVQAFQRSKQLPVSGVIDAATAAILTTAAAAAPPKAATTPASGTSSSTEPLASFPVPATCKFWDTWGAPRSGGRKHEGVDISAASGTAIFAVHDGRITRRQADFPGSRAGNAIWLTAVSGTYYFYGHMSSFAKGVGVGSPVRAGDVIGYVGSTGNSTVPHLHFEVHPGGGGPVNPYPIVKAASSC